ncbi:MAG TPA: cysteine desulfurase [Terriglobia bacterium]|nr:cysteine desulfurase [Terriglobia bacterium]
MGTTVTNEVAVHDVVAAAAVQAQGSSPALAAFDVERIRRDFPILHQQVHGKPLVYLDNAATSQKPLAVIDAERDFYLRDCANIHRGVHELSERATRRYEGVRTKIQHLLNAREAREIIFLRGTTEALNLVASGFGRAILKPGDEVLITALEHHSNIVPWQMLRDEKGIVLRVAPINDAGELEWEEFERLLGPRTRLVSLAHVSNVLGTINPLKRVVAAAHERNVPVLVDGAQAAPHLKVDVQDLDCDFYAFSSHKIFGPTGVGALYGKAAWLEKLPPYQGGGDMIRSVSFEKTIYNVIPYKFEAGTPNIGATIGLGAAIDYVHGVGLDNIGRHEHGLLAYGTERLSDISGLRIVGTARQKAAVISFVVEGIHPHDLGTVLDQEGVAIRTGHHCAEPLMHRYGVPATARASFAFYNTREEIDRLVEAVEKAKELLG